MHPYLQWQLAAQRRAELLRDAQSRSMVRSAGDGRHLTERERQVLVALARGASDAEIADTLLLPRSAVRAHLSQVLCKIGLRDRVQAVVFAYEAGLVRPRRAGPGQLRPPPP